MRRRTKAREEALKLLYQLDITGEDCDPVLDGFFTDRKPEPAVAEFCSRLVRGTRANLARLDTAISRAAENWEIERMAVVDRNILRMATYELFFCPDIPAKVVLNEAVELAKRYGDSESGGFVNGVLDEINKENERERRKNG